MSFSTEPNDKDRSDRLCSRPMLLSPLKIKSITLRNRIVSSPMCQYRSKNGFPSEWQLVNFGKFAVGGAGLVFGEETAVEPLGRKTHHCAGLWDSAQAAAFRRINDFIRSQGAVPAIQIGHSGIKGSCHGAQNDWTALTPENSTEKEPPWICSGPSKLSNQAWPKIKELDKNEIKSLLVSWRNTTLLARDAGYDVLEIHGAHGYLIHQFLSPLTNKRTDQYGGCFENRIRFALEVTEVVRSVWPADLPLFFRVSAVDGKGGIWNLEDTVELSKALRDRGVDVIDCSSGGISGNSGMPVVRRIAGYQVPFAQRIRREAEISTMAVGLITDAFQAEDILQKGQADLIALARELIWNPNWPAHAAHQLSGAHEAFSMLPSEQSHRLIRREEVSQLAINKYGTGISDLDDKLTETT